MKFKLLQLLLIGAVSSQLVYEHFYPYGDDNNDQLLAYSKDQSAVALDIPLVFMEKSNDEIFLSHNGIIGIGQRLPDEVKPLSKIPTSAIAVFYAPVTSAKIYYRVTSSDSELLKHLTNDVKETFHDAVEFSALQAVIITWTDVQNAEMDGPAAFQLVLVSDGISTYSIIHFGALPWSSSLGYYAQSGFVHSLGKYQPNVNSGGPDVKELVNLSNNEMGSSFYYRISTSSVEDPRESGDEYDYNNYDQDYDKEHPNDCPQDDHIDNCPSTCSVIRDKRGCSRCLCPDAPIKEPNLNTIEDSTEDVHDNDPQEVHIPKQEFPTCATRSEDSCHKDSICQDFDQGFCCKCNVGFFGNGYECLGKSEPQRVTGTFEGIINGITIDQTSLHTFATPTDGSGFTAVSKIPSDLGHTMLLLSPVGSVMGWLFAYVQSPYVYNGFQLTGGQFNRTVTMHVGSKYYVTIKHEFTGRDIYQYFKSHVYVSGTLPNIAPGSEIVFPDYEENYKREKSGYVTSNSAMDVKVVDGATSETFRITFDQQIHFKECPHREFDRDEVVQLQVKRAHATYDSKEGIVRFGSRNYANRNIVVRGEPVTPAPDSVFGRRQHGAVQQVSDAPIQIESNDPCASGRHTCTLAHMKCRTVEPSYRCECDPGFQAAHEQSSPIGWHCVDLNECERGDHSCDQHATCTNTEGAFSCQCQPGFVGDGHTCIRSESPHNIAQAAPIAQMGAGADGSCTAHTQCHQWGECVFTAEHPTGRCKCRGWYVGDGVKHCGPPGEEAPKQNANIPKKGGKPCGTSVCDVNAECMPETSGGSECVCKAGFTGNGITCENLLDDEIQIPTQEAIGKVCRSHSECSEYGSCAYHHQLGYYQCACREPYVGNGVECSLPGSQPNPGVPPPQPFPVPELPANAPGCDTLHNCGLNAQCIYDDHNRRYACECAQGFIGDGTHCVSLSSGQSGLDQSNYEAHPAQPKTCVETSDCHPSGHCVINENGAGEYICECLPGYKGDGFLNCTGADECNPSNPHACQQNAQCAYDTLRNAYACQCIPGFKGNGHSCFPFAQATTCVENPRICHANAQCVSHPETNGHACICKPGSVGDGYTKCDVIETPRCGNCSINAHCAQSTTGGYMCKCNSGFHGNGFVCASMTSCFDDRSICDVNADCVPGEGGHYVCNCHYGYHGDGHSCNPDDVSSSRDQLLIARGMAIFERSTKPESFGKQLIVIPHHIPVGIDYDCEDEKIVWSDVTGHSIRIASLDGTDQKSFYAKELNSPEGVAVDWSSRNVYYADSIDDEIGVLSLDGKYKKVLLSEDLVNPRAVALDLYSRHLYYTDWNRDKPYIGRMDLDGQNNRVFLNEDVHLPNWITILPNRRELCWVDAGNKRLSCIGLNGSGRRTVYSNLVHPFGLTHNNEEKFYWTDWQDNRIHSVGVYGEGYASFQISLGGSGKVYGILGVPKACVGAPTPCGENNGGCKHLCLPGQSGAQCVCPDNVKNC